MPALYIKINVETEEGVFMKLKYILIIFAIIIFAAGCAKPPQAEIDAAREAVYRAENNADAVRFGGASLTRARSALSRMQMEVDSKRYDAAKASAAEAIAAADRAIAEGRSGSGRVREDSISALDGLMQEIEETNRNVSGARYALLDLDYEALDRGLRNAYSDFDQAEIDETEGRYQDAVNKAANIRSNLSNINQLVAGAITRRK